SAYFLKGSDLERLPMPLEKPKCRLGADCRQKHVPFSAANFNFELWDRLLGLSISVGGTFPVNK
ncbi:MAG: hypothetical protein KGS72_24655, partial [Cyanobacteria bacterium REEB67]|nr:hypothetical protein [Cyanobacteria bacterium REEB67]